MYACLTTYTHTNTNVHTHAPPYTHTHRHTLTFLPLPSLPWWCNNKARLTLAVLSVMAARSLSTMIQTRLRWVAPRAHTHSHTHTGRLSNNNNKSPRAQTHLEKRDRGFLLTHGISIYQRFFQELLIFSIIYLCVLLHLGWCLICYVLFILIPCCFQTGCIMIFFSSIDMYKTTDSTLLKNTIVMYILSYC